MKILERYISCFLYPIRKNEPGPMDEIKAIRDNLKEFSVNKLYLAD